MFRLKRFSISNLEKNPSSILLVVLNLLPIFGVIFLNWSLLEIVLSYWTESAVIGFFNVLKMIKTPAVGEKEIKPGHTKESMITFFCIHYSIFMLGHLSAIMIYIGETEEKMTGSMGIDYNFIGTVIIFIAIHWYSYKNNFLAKKEYLNTDVKRLMFAPYGRIVFTHLFIFIAAYSLKFLNTEVAPAIFPFLVCIIVIFKTFFDANFHLKERETNHSKTHYQNID